MGKTALIISGVIIAKTFNASIYYFKESKYGASVLLALFGVVLLIASVWVAFFI